jgi:hypothetical protein
MGIPDWLKKPDTGRPDISLPGWLPKLPTGRPDIHVPGLKLPGFLSFGAGNESPDAMHQRLMEQLGAGQGEGEMQQIPPDPNDPTGGMLPGIPPDIESLRGSMGGAPQGAPGAMPPTSRWHAWRIPEFSWGVRQGGLAGNPLCPRATWRASATALARR